MLINFRGFFPTQVLQFIHLFEMGGKISHEEFAVAMFYFSGVAFENGYGFFTVPSVIMDRLFQDPNVPLCTAENKTKCSRDYYSSDGLERRSRLPMCHNRHCCRYGTACPNPDFCPDGAPIHPSRDGMVFIVMPDTNESPRPGCGGLTLCTLNVPSPVRALSHASTMNYWVSGRIDIVSLC